MGEVKEKGFAFIFPDERYGAICIHRRELTLVIKRFDLAYLFISFDQRKWRIAVSNMGSISHGAAIIIHFPHIIGIRQTKVFIKPMLKWQKRRLLSKVPLACHTCFIPFL